MEMTVGAMEALMLSIMGEDDCLKAGLFPGPGLTGAERHASKPGITAQQRIIEVILSLPEVSMIERRGFIPIFERHVP
jgi:hypothetical protein